MRGRDNRTKPYVLHAEANAITKWPSRTTAVKGQPFTSLPAHAWNVPTYYPAGIRRVVFCDNYRMQDGVELLKKVKLK